MSIDKNFGGFMLKAPLFDRDCYGLGFRPQPVPQWLWEVIDAITSGQLAQRTLLLVYLPAACRDITICAMFGVCILRTSPIGTD